MSQLNEQQAKSVDHNDGAMLVVAGAGTGKTRVIVERIARLIDGGVPRDQILALTFTEKAAQEMLDRVSETLDDSYGIELNIFTFNAFGQEVLREFAADIGFSPAMRLVGDTGKVVLLREHLDELGLDYYAPVSSPDAQLGAIADYFSKLKQQLITPASYAKFADGLPSGDEAEKLEKLRHSELAAAFGSYIAITQESNVIDYDDQIYRLVKLLEERPNVLAKLQDRFRYLLVDEFQDTNPMQSLLLDLLAGESKNVMAVGDDDQSIYGWRGATLANILDFNMRYPDSTSVTLVDNYRSSQSILDTAYKLIQNNNPDRLEEIQSLDKKLISHSKESKQPMLEHFDRLDAEIDWISEDIQRRIEKGEDPGSIAVLTRRNAGARRISESLSYKQIEHDLAGVREDLYKQPIIGSMIEALHAVADRRNDVAIYHTLTGPLFSIEAGHVGDRAAETRRTHQPLEEKLAEDEVAQKAIVQLRSWREQMHERTVSELAYHILDDSGLKDALYIGAETNELDAHAVQALGQWFESLREFQSVSNVATAQAYLDNLEALKAGGEALDEESFRNDVPVVMSVHKAKGLEWDVVYIADCTEYSFPLRAHRSSLSVPDELVLSSGADDHYAEERRLMYVAVTRARKELILSYSDSHTGTTKRKPSRFLSEMFGDDFEGGLKTSQAAQVSLDLFAAGTGDHGKKVQLPARMRSGDKLVLSASQLNDYFRCPLDFYYRHVLHVPSEPSPASSVGTLFHELIQQINMARIQGNSVPSLEELQQQLKDKWPSEGFLSAKQRERASEQAHTSLGDVYQRLTSGPSPISSEEAFRVEVPETNVVITGRIDAVFEDSDGVRIVDYKTSTSATTPEKAKSSATRSKQLELYALAWNVQHGELPHSVELDFVQTNQVGNVKKRASTIEKLPGVIKDAAEHIHSGDYPLGRSHDYCRHPEKK